MIAIIYFDNCSYIMVVLVPERINLKSAFSENKHLRGNKSQTLKIKGRKRWV